MSDKQTDVMAILKLYELRRDATMREARAWYFTKFSPQSAADIAKLYMSGERESAFYRMVVSYWDMAASFVNNGALDERLFIDANSEPTFVYARVEPYLTEVRQMFKEPEYLLHLEQIAKKYSNLEDKLAVRRRLYEHWQKNDEG
ncbi:MAG: hypothetical protein H0U50_09525 [Pyrinomonadaceae bacterium]|nr:hypothetical protein [Pyrinomonadaceae bacterium]